MIRTTASQSTVRMSGGSPERDLDLETTIELCPNNSPCTLRKVEEKPYCTLQYATQCPAYRFYEKYRKL